VVVASDEQSVPPKGQALTAGGTTQAAPTRAAATQAAPTRAAATDAASPPPQYGPADPMFRR
jgi:Tfp pilus assembly protein PilW